jgi:hypothetical protein
VSGTILHSDRGFQYTSHDYHNSWLSLASNPACREEAIAWTMPLSRASSPT